MKAVILAAGRGKRLEDETKIQSKCMIIFQGKHLIEYSFENAILSKVKEIIVVIGHKAEDIVNAFGSEYKGIKITYVIQKERRGLVSAIETVQASLEGEDFILFLGDEILMGESYDQMIELFEKEDLFVVCGVVKVKDNSQIKKTYSLIYNEDDNMIYRLIEKPRRVSNNIMGTGNCIFKNGIFDFIPYVGIHHVRHEKELPDLIQCVIDDGFPCKLFHLGSKYINVNTPEDIVLAEKTYKISGKND